MQTDLNCDMGESYGRFKIGNDEALFPYISSCNIACGFHGGDPLTIEKTISRSIEFGVRIGAHPSYPDLAGFGRRSMKIEETELKSILRYQVFALKGMVESLGGSLAYVKPHGALYNDAAKSRSVSLVIIDAIRSCGQDLALMGLAGSITEEEALGKINFIAEAFADRTYQNDGSLTSRNEKNAVISDPSIAAKQVLSIIKDNQITSVKGKLIPVKAESICIHGDNPQAVSILQAIHQKLEANSISIRQSRP